MWQSHWLTCPPKEGNAILRSRPLAGHGWGQRLVSRATHVTHLTPMAIKNWHIGKVVLVWVVGLGIGGPLFGFAVGDLYPFTMVLLGLAVVLLVTPSVVIWKWFGGRESNNPPPSL